MNVSADELDERFNAVDETDFDYVAMQPTILKARTIHAATGRHVWLSASFNRQNARRILNSVLASH